MRPVIGITCGTAGVPVAEGMLPSYYLGEGYSRAVWAAGGTPLVLPAVPGEEQAQAEAVIGLLDGLLLAGGTDIHPERYGSVPDGAQKPDRSRDAFESELLDWASARNLPTLGICRGLQMINVWSGGSLSQHLPHTASEEVDLDGLRVESTRVKLTPGSRVSAIFDEPELLVRCLHHQAIDSVGSGMKAVGFSTDGLVEALESVGSTFMLGLLWHPEQMLEARESLLPYSSLVEAASR